MDALELVGRAVLVFGLLGATLWAVRRVDRSRGTRTDGVQLLSSARLGKGASVALVRIGDRTCALGVTEHGVQLLTQTAPEPSAAATRQRALTPEPDRAGGPELDPAGDPAVDPAMAGFAAVLRDELSREPTAAGPTTPGRAGGLPLGAVVPVPAQRRPRTTGAHARGGSRAVSGAHARRSSGGGHARRAFRLPGGLHAAGSGRSGR